MNSSGVQQQRNNGDDLHLCHSTRQHQLIARKKCERLVTQETDLGAINNILLSC